MMKDGGKKNKKELMEKFGMDEQEKGLWKKGIQVIEGIIEEIEEMEE